MSSVKPGEDAKKKKTSGDAQRAHDVFQRRTYIVRIELVHAHTNRNGRRA
jgi:hypothetical protein